MVVVWTDGFTVQIPADIWCGEASDLDWDKRQVALLFPLHLPLRDHTITVIWGSPWPCRNTDLSILINLKCEALGVNACMCVIHLEVNPTEASLLYSEVWRDLQEARSVTFLLDSWALICPLISPWVVPPPAGTETDDLFIIHFQWLNFTVHWWQHTHTNHINTDYGSVSVIWQHDYWMKDFSIFPVAVIRHSVQLGIFMAQIK